MCQMYSNSCMIQCKKTIIYVYIKCKEITKKINKNIGFKLVTYKKSRKCCMKRLLEIERLSFDSELSWH